MQEQAKPVRILFVCTGNICRSPTAEGVFRHLVRSEGLEDRIGTDSAGTHDYHVGEPPDPRSVAAAMRRGYDIKDLRARRLAPDDFARFDLLLAMDRGHLRLMRRLAPAPAAPRLRLFLDYAPRLGLSDVPDPYYGDARDFESALGLIEHGARGLLDALRGGGVG
jgi:protein-tyrosine phosphatase